jgi:putative flippase GtrA
MRGSFVRRWVAFNGIGALGVVVQLAVLGLLVNLAEVHYLVATALAVETALLHNFGWHQRWTWRDRPSATTAATLARLGRFHVLNGSVSLAGNLMLMAVLSGALGIDPLPANVMAILACSTVNFAASEVLVFRTASIVAAVAVGMLTVPATTRAADLAAELTAATVGAWQQYERAVDERYDRPAPPAGPFFAQDVFAEAAGTRSDWRQPVIAGTVSMMRIRSAAPGAAEPTVPAGRIHHWAGAVFIPDVTVDRVIRHLQDRAGRESESYEDVTASKLISRDGDRLRVYMRLKRVNIITVTYNTEHAVAYRRLSASRATSRSVSTRIAEIMDAGTPGEREKPVGNDHGFLWRLNAYWRFEQVKGGVLIECESVSLSRDVPALLRLLVNRTVEGIARESLDRTLLSLRADLKRSLPAPR